MEKALKTYKLKAYLVKAFGFDKEDIRTFLYILLLMSILFAVDFYYFALTSILTYAIIIVLSAGAITWARSFLGKMMDIKATVSPWISGFVISAVVTVLFSIAGMPILVPVISSSEHRRALTLKGMKKGEVNIHESWSFSMFSSMVIVLFGLLFVSLWVKFHNPGFMAAGSFLLFYVLISFLPQNRFDGAFLAYHNLPMYIIIFVFLLIITFTAIFYFLAAFIAFLVFASFSFISLKMKLW
ncbi:hypothetical protein M1293_01050 [Candidatus Parvarchaeota archaeon]|nr:hypothetical protein [Candidatus Parvarchaeota archaeon]